MYKINKTILKKCKEIGHCICNLNITCPCDEFLDNDKCKCGAYKRWFKMGEIIVVICAFVSIIIYGIWLDDYKIIKRMIQNDRKGMVE